ncbi:MAG: hypothetical protein ACE15D_12665 [Candidatus Eisenbacteria bacterium]
MNARPTSLGRRATLCGIAVVLGLLAAAVAVPVVASATVTLRPFSPGSGAPAPLAVSLDAFWTQAPDLNGSKISSESSYVVDLDSMVGVDFVTTSDDALTKVVWWGGYYNNWQEGESEVTDFYIYICEDQGGVPGSYLGYYYATPTITAAGNDGLGLPVYKYEAPVRVDVQADTRYWLIVQADDNGYPPQWGWLQSTEVRENQAKFQSDYFGHPEWVDASTVADEAWDGAFEIHVNTPTLEPCCLPIGYCDMLLPTDCTEQQGIVQEGQNDCSTVECPQPPACCTMIGCILLPEADCVEAGGTSQAPGSTCDPDPCPPTQACCSQFFGCLMMTPDGCTQSGGTAQGEGTTCDPNPCPVTGQACCILTFCQVMDVDLCTQAGGTPQGEGTECDPNPCGEEEQACCDGETCTMVVPSGCAGVPQGTGSVCEPNPCLPTPQACCFPDVHCELLAPDACDTAGGVPAGFGSTCETVPCPYPVRVDSRSWGAIKATFR